MAVLIWIVIGVLIATLLIILGKKYFAVNENDLALVYNLSAIIGLTWFVSIPLIFVGLLIWSIVVLVKR